MCIYCIYNRMNVCKWCMSNSATENSILQSVLQRLNNIFNHFNQSINNSSQYIHVRCCGDKYKSHDQILMRTVLHLGLIVSKWHVSFPGASTFLTMA